MSGKKDKKKKLSREKFDDEPRETEQRNYRLGVQLACPFNKHHGISVDIQTAKNDGAGAEFDLISVGYRYAWGHGF